MFLSQSAADGCLMRNRHGVVRRLFSDCLIGVLHLWIFLWNDYGTSTAIYTSGHCDEEDLENHNTNAACITRQHWADRRDLGQSHSPCAVLPGAKAFSCFWLRSSNCSERVGHMAPNFGHVPPKYDSSMEPLGQTSIPHWHTKSTMQN